MIAMLFCIAEQIKEGKSWEPEHEKQELADLIEKKEKVKLVFLKK